VQHMLAEYELAAVCKQSRMALLQPRTVRTIQDTHLGGKWL
jgi:hypothetical protein